MKNTDFGGGVTELSVYQCTSHIATCQTLCALRSGSQQGGKGAPWISTQTDREIEVER